MATKVALRQKSISKGRKSLYLDFYPAIINPETGEPTRREFLGLYLFIDKAELKKNIQDSKKKGNDVEVFEQLYKELKPLTSAEKKHNEETLKIAESIRQKRDNFINKPEIYSHYEKEQLRLKEVGEQNFVEYFKKLADKRKASNHDNWISAYNYLRKFTNGVLPFNKLTEQFFNDFKEYLLTTKSLKNKKVTLSQNSAVSYFNKVKASIKQAYKDNLLQHDLNAKVSPIKAKETHREFLTIEELNSLAKTPCNNDLLKRAALFSALTGLRYSDIKKLTWSEIQFVEGHGYFLKFEQEKTEGIQYLPISEQAVSLCGQVREPNNTVFEGLKYTAYHSKHLGQWLGAAGITKDITFHNFRHTFATLQLFSGTDIYTLSKMLGHKDLKTTQVYAKVVDETKRKASYKIKLDL